MSTRRLPWAGLGAAALIFAAAPAAAEGPPEDADSVDVVASADAPAPDLAVTREPSRPSRVAPDRRRDGNELNRHLARGGMALELVVRLATVGYAAQSCGGAACDRVSGMLPVAGPLATAASGSEHRALAAALATFEATSLALAALGVVDAWSHDRGRIRVGLRGPGLVVAGEF